MPRLPSFARSVSEFPGAHTKSPWPGHLDLAVKGKTFAYLSIAGGGAVLDLVQAAAVRQRPRSCSRTRNQAGTGSERAVGFSADFTQATSCRDVEGVDLGGELSRTSAEENSSRSELPVPDRAADPVRIQHLARSLGIHRGDGRSGDLVRIWIQFLTATCALGCTRAHSDGASDAASLGLVLQPRDRASPSSARSVRPARRRRASRVGWAVLPPPSHNLHPPLCSSGEKRIFNASPAARR